jgi:hypothetical protein
VLEETGWAVSAGWFPVVADAVARGRLRAD